MKLNLIRIIFFSLTALIGLLFMEAAGAVPFGTFDPRSLSMGGAGVASGTSANAAYYNPALMAMYRIRKERGNNSRFLFPITTLRVTDSLRDLADADEDQLDQELADSINTFNANQTAQNARGVLVAATDLQSNLDTLLDGPVQAEANVGMILGIGHKYEGGAIIINRRTVGDGVVTDFESDLQLLEDYVNAMELIEAGQVAQAISDYPNVVQPDGQITDQTGNLTSEATASDLIVTEIGMAMSKQFNVFGRDIAFGITPKIMQVTTYDLTADATTGDSTTVKDENQDFEINLDFGIAHEIDSQWRVGLVIKNIRSLSYTTSLGSKINIDPQVRAGVAYDLGRQGLYAFDMDMVENDPVGTGSNSQVMSLGAEWPYFSFLKFRGGISRNMKGIGAGGDPVFSLGIHWGSGFFLDVGVAGNSYEKAVSSQLGVTF